MASPVGLHHPLHHQFLMAYSQSAVKSWRRCQKQYAFRRDYAPEGKELVPKVPKLALNRGSWMHELQQAHHRRWAGLEDSSADWEAVQAKNVRKFNAYFEEDREELGDLPAETRRLFRAYLRHWGEDEERYEVATLHDGSPAVEFTIEIPLTQWGIRDPFKGRTDLLVRDLEYGGLWVWDAKWVKRIPDIDDRMMSPQALLYAWGLRRLDYDVQGFLFNYGRTKAPTIPRVLKRPAGTLSLAKKIDTDFYTYAMAIKKLHGKKWQFMARTYYKDMLIYLKGKDKAFFRRERVPVDEARIKQAVAEFLISVKQIERRAKPHQAPRSYFYNCSHFCDYHDLCVTEFNGLNIQPLIKNRYQLVPERYTEEEELLVA